MKRGRSFSASPAQREKIRGEQCVFCMRIGPCDPAHVVPRSLGGCDDPLCVVPLCRNCHRAYDVGYLDLLPSLEPHYREELAHAMGHVGLVGLYRRVTNDRKAAA
jgi:hypothetical protein